MASNITCPHCGRSIEVAEALRQEIESTVLATERAKHERQLEAARQQATTAAEAKVREQVAVELTAQRDDAAEQRRQNTSLRDELISLTKQLRESRDERDQFKLTMEKEFLTREEGIVAKARQQAAEELHLKLAEKDKQLQDVTKKLKEAELKSQQGSQQAQGEVLELELEQFLRTQFPFDDIRPVPKGVTGADVVQTVRDQQGSVMGTIVWELKNTKAWSDGWVPKLKHDQRAITADLAVIVTTALPPTVDHFGLQDGVWITDRPTVLGVATALRVSLRQVYITKRREAGKTEKAAVLYEYLCSAAFAHRVEAMIEAYDAQFSEIEKEKRFFATKWARQERSVRTMIEQTHGLYGDLQSILGRALPEMKALSVPALS